MNFPIVSILSDTGAGSATAGMIVAFLTKHYRNCKITEITHDADPANIWQTAFLFAKAYKHFPTGTIHLLLYGIHAHQRPRILLAEHNGHYFITPDNGILPFALEKQPDKAWLCKELSGNFTTLDWLKYSCDIIEIITEKADINQHYLPFRLALPNSLNSYAQLLNGRQITCNIVHIDRYGNIVLNLKKADLLKYTKDIPFVLQPAPDVKITSICNSYNEVAEGELLCRANSIGLLEICQNRGNAAERLHLNDLADSEYRYKMIPITILK